MQITLGSVWQDIKQKNYYARVVSLEDGINYQKLDKNGMVIGFDGFSEEIFLELFTPDIPCWERLPIGQEIETLSGSIVKVIEISPTGKIFWYEYQSGLISFTQTSRAQESGWKLITNTNTITKSEAEKKFFFAPEYNTAQDLINMIKNK